MGNCIILLFEIKFIATEMCADNTKPDAKTLFRGSEKLRCSEYNKWEINEMKW